MADDPKGQTGDGRLKKTWNLLLQTAVWISSFTASIVLPPTGVTISEADPAARILKFTNYIIAVVVGLSLIATKKLNRKKHLWLWIVLTAIFFCSSCYLIYRSYELNNSLTCICNNQTVVKGTQYKAPQVVKLYFPNGVDCPTLCQNFVTTDKKVVPEKVWTETSINDSRRTLFLNYLGCFPLVALTIICVVQAIYCSTRKE